MTVNLPNTNLAKQINDLQRDVDNILRRRIPTPGGGGSSDGLWQYDAGVLQPNPATTTPLDFFQVTAVDGITLNADVDGAVTVLQGGAQSASADFGEIQLYGPGFSDGIVEINGRATGGRYGSIRVLGHDVPNAGYTDAGAVEIRFNKGAAFHTAIEARMRDSDGALKVGFFEATPVVKQTLGATLTNNVMSGGTANTIANYTDLVTYSNDAAAIRNDIYQLAQYMKLIGDALRLYGLLT